MLLLEPKRSRLEYAGTGCILVSVVFLLILFAPVLWQELRYQLSHTDGMLPLPINIIESTHPSVLPTPEKNPSPHPVDEEFGIVIQKIGANAKVIPEVDWQDSRVYQQALTQGVAHALGSALPGESGNVFLFAHAGASPFEALRYNAVFYLIDKLESGDTIEVWHKRTRYTYQVNKKEVVDANAVQYVEREALTNGLTLMTCWPAGTTWKRLIVQAVLQQS